MKILFDNVYLETEFKMKTPLGPVVSYENLNNSTVNDKK